ncbi:MAG: hypothetical protein CSB06_02830 [Bacteroidia bacterium]|nr:MAG: hypothetical protein CSB06_02830 [Bacteroidia bacterium]
MNILNLFETKVGEILDNTPSKTGNQLKPRLLSIESGKLVTEIEITPAMSNPLGTAHGGFIALIADEMIGWTISTLNMPEPFPTINLNIDYLYPISIGEKLCVDTEITRKGNTIIHTECRMYDSNKKLLAKACSNNIKLKK